MRCHQLNRCPPLPLFLDDFFPPPSFIIPALLPLTIDTYYWLPCSTSSAPPSIHLCWSYNESVFWGFLFFLLRHRMKKPLRRNHNEVIHLSNQRGGSGESKHPSVSVSVRPAFALSARRDVCASVLAATRGGLGLFNSVFSSYPSLHTSLITLRPFITSQHRSSDTFSFLQSARVKLLPLPLVYSVK